MSPSNIGGDELRVQRDVVARLDRAGVEYMLTGSVAMAIYTQPRMTRDLDLVIELAPSRASEVAGLFEADFLAEPDELRRAAAIFDMANLIHLESSTPALDHTYLHQGAATLGVANLLRDAETS